MANRATNAAGGACVVLLLSGMLASSCFAEDLSRYRDFQFGMELSAVAKRIEMNSSPAKTLHLRPALIQELSWRPQPLGSSSRAESVKEVVFTFSDGALFRIVVDYDRNETEGLTTSDFVEALAASYGTPVKMNAPVAIATGPYGELEGVLARWEDEQYRFDLIPSAFGPGFRLIGVGKNLAAQAQTSQAEAKRLDDLEAPQRDAARAANEEAAARAKLEKARLENKPKFRP